MDSNDLFYQMTRGSRFRNCGNSPQEPKQKIFKIVEEKAMERSIGQMEQQTDISALHFNKSHKQMKIHLDEQREQLIEKEITNTIRKKNCITVLGKVLPPPITTFEELHARYNMNEKLVHNLSTNYSKPTAIQMQAIPIMLKGRHLMASAPTGSGKTIAYLAPVLNDLKLKKKLGVRALILAPTRELAQQIYRECIRLSENTSLKVHIVRKVGKSKINFAKASSKEIDIIISTPNRIRFLLQQEPAILDLKSIEWFILDEADRLMEDGQDNFKDQLDVILAACSKSRTKLALFSATYTVPLAKWALKHLKNLIRVNIGVQNAASVFVKQELLFVGSENGKLLAVRDMIRHGLKPPVLVFVQSRDRANQLLEELLYDGINVDVIHADRTQLQRENCVRAFREGHIWILICTELMGRGMDFKSVNLVINYDFPPTTTSYIHRIGRTGRAGRPGKAITFFTQDDIPQLRSIADIIRNSGGNVPDFMLKMKKTKKTGKKKFVNFTPNRDDISTKIKPEQQKLHK